MPDLGSCTQLSFLLLLYISIVWKTHLYMKPKRELWTPVLLNGGIFKDEYLVSNMGRVKRKHVFKSGRVTFFLVNIINSKRPLVKIKGNGRQYSKSVAKLVLSSFCYREGCECANVIYLDGNMKNCELSNLRYAVDESIYTALDLKNKSKPVKKGKQKIKSDKSANPAKKPVLKKSCSTCAKNPCMSGMASFKTDFGACGCNHYKPRETDIS